MANELISCCFLLDFIILSLLSIAAIANEPEEKRKPYNENLSIACPGCAGNSECTVTINGAAMDMFTMVNGSLSLPADNWNVYGELCCGGDVEETIMCYRVCPLYYGEL